MGVGERLTVGEWSAAYDELVRTSPKATIKWEDFAWAMTARDPTGHPTS